MAMQQFSGIDGVLYYAPLLFQQAGLESGQASFLASGVSSLVIFAVTIPASIYADNMGRRASTILGGLAMVAVMLLIGSLYASHAVYGDHGVARWAVIVCIYIFAVAFSMTWAISLRIYSSEIQPAATRASATNLAQSANWVHFILFFPRSQHHALMGSIDIELHRRAHNTDTSRQIFIRSLLPLRWLHAANGSGVSLLDAGDEGQELGSY
jgi:MFS family permease